MSKIVKLSLAGYNAQSDTDKRHFSFHSDYNTFKIIKSGTFSFNIADGATTDGSVAHGLSYTPPFMVFLTKSGDSKAIGIGGCIFTSGTSAYYALLHGFSDATNLYVRVKNTTGAQITVTVRYYLFEAPL